MTRRRGIFVFVKRCRFAKSPLKKGGLNTTGQLFRIPLVKQVLHILEVNLQRPDRDLNLQIETPSEPTSSSNAAPKTYAESSIRPK